jgi:CRISPR-associated endonuclease/helicase Cas3
MLNKNFIAYSREKDNKDQFLTTHLQEVGDITAILSNKLGIFNAGQLIGLLHDLGKFSSCFQLYINSAIGKLNPDDEYYVDFKKLKGKIDHSTAGA